MAKCPNCKVKLVAVPNDKVHPFYCPKCGNENFYLDERTGTMKW